MKIRYKILWPMVASVLLAIAAVLITVILIFSGYMDGTMQAETAGDAEFALARLEDMSGKALLASRYIAADDALRAAVAATDRQGIIAAAGVLSSGVDVDFITVTDVHGTVLARTHEPENYGDSVGGQQNVIQALSGIPYTTIEKGTAVKLSIRSGVPVYDAQGALVGAVSTGYRLDQNSYVDDVKALIGSEITVFLDDERISTTVTQEDGTRAIGTKASEAVSGTVLAGTPYHGVAQILGRDAYSTYLPLRSSEGDVVGMLFAGLYAEGKTATVASFISQGLLVALILLLLFLPIIFILTGNIAKPIRTMVGAADLLADGDVTANVTVRGRDEMGQLASSFNRMIDQTRGQAEVIRSIADGDLSVSIDARSDRDVVSHALISMLELNNDVFSQIMLAADQVSQGARQVAQGAQSLAQSNTQQASAMDELFHSVASITETTRRSADMAGESAEINAAMRAQAESSARQMAAMTAAVREINEASASIEKIIKVIEDIANQTNILAINASIEAARAGQYGKGFSVVADEVRALAGKSAAAARDTAQMIAQSIEKANLGSRIAGEAEAMLGQIVQGIGRSAGMAGEISGAAHQQAAAIEQINRGMDQVSQAVQVTSSLSQQTAASSQEMSSQAHLLNDLVDRFKLRGDDTRARLPAPSGSEPRELP